MQNWNINIFSYSSQWTSSKPPGFQRNHHFPHRQMGSRSWTGPKLQDYLRTSRRRKITICKEHFNIFWLILSGWLNYRWCVSFPLAPTNEIAKFPSTTVSVLFNIWKTVILTASECDLSDYNKMFWTLKICFEP